MGATEAALSDTDCGAFQAYAVGRRFHELTGFAGYSGISASVGTELAEVVIGPPNRATANSHSAFSRGPGGQPITALSVYVLSNGLGFTTGPCSRGSGLIRCRIIPGTMLPDYVFTIAFGRITTTAEGEARAERLEKGNEAASHVPGVPRRPPVLRSRQDSLTAGSMTATQDNASLLSETRRRRTDMTRRSFRARIRSHTRRSGNGRRSGGVGAAGGHGAESSGRSGDGRGSPTTFASPLPRVARRVQQR